MGNGEDPYNWGDFRAHLYAATGWFDPGDPPPAEFSPHTSGYSGAMINQWYVIIWLPLKMILWQAGRQGAGENACDWTAFRQHLQNIGDADPGDTAPSEFGGSSGCGTPQFQYNECVGCRISRAVYRDNCGAYSYGPEQSDPACAQWCAPECGEPQFQYNECVACNESRPVYVDACGNYTTGPNQYDSACANWCPPGDSTIPVGGVGAGIQGPTDLAWLSRCFDPVLVLASEAPGNDWRRWCQELGSRAWLRVMNNGGEWRNGADYWAAKCVGTVAEVYGYGVRVLIPINEQNLADGSEGAGDTPADYAVIADWWNAFVPAIKARLAAAGMGDVLIVGPCLVPNSNVYGTSDGYFDAMAPALRGLDVIGVHAYWATGNGTFLGEPLASQGAAHVETDMAKLGSLGVMAPLAVTEYNRAVDVSNQADVDNYLQQVMQYNDYLTGLGVAAQFIYLATGYQEWRAYNLSLMPGAMETLERWHPGRFRTGGATCAERGLKQMPDGSCVAVCPSGYVENPPGFCVLPPNPVRVSLTANKPNVAAGAPVVFTANAVGGSGGYSYAWEFGDGYTAFGSAPRYDHTYREAGTYAAKVTVTDSLGARGVSNAVTITVAGAPTVPAAPSGLTATPSGTQIDLRWVRNSTNEQGFAVDMATAGGSFSQLLTVGAGVITARATNLTPGGMYTFRVRAYNALGYSGYSNVAAATIPLPGEFAVALAADKAQVGVQEPVTFTARITGGRAPYALFYDFGDGQSLLTELQRVMHAYGDADAELTVTVEATDAQGERAVSNVVIITVRGATPPPPAEGSGLGLLLVAGAAVAGIGALALLGSRNGGDR